MNAYADSIDAYLAAAWTGLLALPAGQKFPPPKHTTGYGNSDPDIAQIRAWAQQPHNIALRLPPNVIGIDVDAYGDKIGAETLKELEKTLGALPATWTVTSRQDGVSGIRLFKAVISGNNVCSHAGTDIDVIRYEHRYAVVWPSIHPSGDMYRWRNPDGVIVDSVPHIDELPVLPTAWVAYISRTPRQTAAQRTTQSSSKNVQIFDFLQNVTLEIARMNDLVTQLKQTSSQS